MDYTSEIYLYSFIYFIYLASLIICAASLWKIFEKAGRLGWISIIPIYNLYVTMEVAGKPGWWIIFYIVPIVNIFISIIVSISLAKSFGKSTVFGVFGLWLFKFVGYMILGFGKNSYVGPGGVRPQSTLNTL